MVTAGAIRLEHSPNGGIVASHEATDALNRAMRIVPYRPGSMVIKIAISSIHQKFFTSKITNN
jgi:hypothetical protein